jgi:Sulfotransferase family
VRLRARLGRWWRPRGGGARRLYAPPPADALTLGRGLAVIARRWPEVRSASRARPIFLLAAGFRCGSTFLQRLVTASGEVIVWGEPWGHAALIETLAAPLRCVTDAWPHDDWFLRGGERPQTLSARWIANLYPTMDDMLAAHLGFFDALFDAPARRAGVARWGLKETRLGVDHARYLKWLFPGARVVLLYRDPFDAYRSYRRWRSWYLRWPDDPVEDAARFGAHWRTLVADFVGDVHDVDALVVRYEDLAAGRATAALGAHLELALPEPATLARIGARMPAPARVEEPARPLSDEDVATLQRQVGALAADLGYVPR